MSEPTAQNPYAAPSSVLQEPQGNQVPSIEEALSRGYDFSIGGMISEAWSLLKGTKGIILGSFIVFFIAMSLIVFVLSTGTTLLGLTGGEESMGMMITSQNVSTLLIMALAYPFMAGLMMIGIRRAAGQPLSFNEIFSHFGRAVPLLITALIMTLLINLGMLVLLIPGIYLSIAYLLAIPLVVERGLSPWQALEASRKAITQHWFKVFGLYFMLTLIMLLSTIPMGIGLIWSLPLMIVTMGVLYRTIFGVLPVSN